MRAADCVRGRSKRRKTVLRKGQTVQVYTSIFVNTSEKIFSLSSSTMSMTPLNAAGFLLMTRGVPSASSISTVSDSINSTLGESTSLSPTHARCSPGTLSLAKVTKASLVWKSESPLEIKDEVGEH